ncbi:MAG: ribulose-phosphate 3-epimerase [Opitutaceae bacterium]
MHSPLLAPSLLAGDHARLADSVKVVEDLGLERIHLDIMDGHFVPNFSFGPQTIAALRPGSKLFFETHLMLDEPQRYIEPFIKAGSNLLSIHIEPLYDHVGTLAKIRSLGCQCGIVLNPGTPATAISALLPLVDLVLVMTVQPGFGGQPFRHDMLPKLRQIADWRQAQRLNFRLEVDGGIDLTNAPDCHAAGADTFVAGTSFYAAADRRAFVQAFAQLR